MVIKGIVAQGKHLGRRLGFPTANVEPLCSAGAWPVNGVYACAIWIGRDPLAWPAMLNQGVHPTAPEGKPTIEAHIMGFEGDIYGKAVRVEYLRFLRPERRFESLNALVGQLRQDRRDVLDWLDGARARSGASPEAARAAEIAWHRVNPDV